MKEYSRTWKRPKVYKDIEEAEEDMESKENKVIENYLSLGGAQVEALYA